MKCPKCGYLGFETTDRCRNCGYDFSLAPFTAAPDLALQSPDRSPEGAPDFDLPSMTPQADALGAGALDLDRLFGAEESVVSAGEAVTRAGGPGPNADPSPLLALATDDPDADGVYVLDPPVAPAAPDAPDAPGAGALPFDDRPPMAPPPARPPLAVRRTTDFPRGRSRTTRPVRVEPTLALALEPPAAPAPAAAAPEPMPLDPPTLGERLGADAIDLGLLVAIHATVLALTLRIAGLEWTLADLRVVPPIPFAGFVVLMSVGYVAMFTVAGGQTIGKMLMHVRVIGDDGRSIDLAGGVLRALGCLLVPMTLGLTYVPVFATTDRRALHDRLAGTRVVRE